MIATRLFQRSVQMTAGVACVLFSQFLYAGEPPTVASEPSSYLGITGFSVNGRIHPHGVPTDYYVEYGPTADYGNSTDRQPLPPRLAAYYHETWNEGWNGWRSWDFDHPHFTEGGSSGGFIRYRAIERDDHNHDDAIGTVHLAKYMYPGRFTPIPSAFLAAGDPDFRDAKISIDVRGNDWQPNGTELMWWSQNQLNPELNPEGGGLSPDYRHSNWAYTGFNLTQLLRSGEWNHAEYRLNNNTNDWTYAGNNNDAQRYDAYASINDIQRHLNIDFFHMVCFVDVENRPTGSIDFDELEIAYRNYSLLFPSNGGSLTSAPEGSDDDPETLTDGWRHGAKKMWKSKSQPREPLEFVYSFAKPVTIEAVQIHQHPEWPSRDVEVLVSNDGTSWTKIVEGAMEENHAEGLNYNFLIKRPLDAAAKMAKVRILSGYKPEHWGLGEIELFGSGATMLTDDDWYNITLDINELQPGETYHYRVVALNADGKTVGADQTVTLPTDTKPHVITGEASRIAEGSAKLEGRLNPLGLKTQFYFEYGPDTNYGSQTKLTYGGKMITPRLAFGHAEELTPGKVYHYRLVAENDTGRSVGDDMTFTAK
ncbi:MAG: hypothetical protein O3A29_21125 [Planctomycetota bacterium]|nr:hypothetical protein [Planctomycetota bacterium]